MAANSLKAGQAGSQHAKLELVTVRAVGKVSTASGDFDLVPLGEELKEAVCELEPRCYTHPWSRPLIMGEFEKDISFRFGLLKEGQLAGYCFAYLVVDELLILNFAIAPEFQRRGLGSALLRSVLKQAQSLGATLACLEVRRSNITAQTLYTRFGFKQVAIRRGYYRDNLEDALVLELRDFVIA